MSIKLVMLKSGEDIIADVKELKSNDEVVGYYFMDPQVVKVEESEAPTVLNEDGSFTKYSSKINVTLFPWVPLAAENKIPCSADWVITIVEPVEKLTKQYQEKIDGRNKSDKSPSII
tara:strand:+ start:84 stop:434 length:351 start_codon:yes stop_codon:yes gene_type:complete